MNGLPVDHYDYLFHFGEKNAGALEHSLSSLYVLRDGPYTDDIKHLLKGIAAHEFFHIVTPLNIHSELIKEFQFRDPNTVISLVALRRGNRMGI